MPLLRSGLPALLTAAFAGLWVLGCARPLIPPPADVGAVVPGAQATAQTDLEVVELDTFTGVNVGATRLQPLEGTPMAIDVGGTLGLSWAVARGGIWLGGDPEGPGAAVRVGGMVGTGDVLGFRPFRYPVAGGNVAIQAAWPTARGDLVSLSVSGGVSGGLAPVHGGDEYSVTLVDGAFRLRFDHRAELPWRFGYYTGADVGAGLTVPDGSGFLILGTHLGFILPQQRPTKLDAPLPP